ncbi:MAG: hypothetical protein ACI4WM_09460 [Erysipelotrichaceae bacterium]
MWKWTDPQNIKMLILDADSLDNEYLNYNYQTSIGNSLIIIKVRMGFETIISF